MSITFKNYLKENDQPLLTSREEIIDWMKKLRVGTHSIEITDEGVINTQGAVDLFARKLDNLPVQFGRVGGDQFLCGQNNFTTLKGCPHEVKGLFQAIDMPHLESYEYLPKKAKIITISASKNNTLLGVQWDTISAQIFSLDTNIIKSGGIGLLLINGLKSIEEGQFANMTEPFKIISKYVGRPDGIFECQYELIEAGFEEYAKL